MSLKSTGQLLSTGLGVTRWGRWFAAMGVVAAVCSGVAFGVGVRWERGAQALSEVQQQRTALQAKDAELADLRKAAKDIKQSALDLATDYRAAVNRQGDITNDWIEFGNSIDRHFNSQADRLEGLIGGMPNCDGGDRVRDHWNRATEYGNSNNATEPAAAGDRQGAAPRVRPDAAGGGRALPDAGAHPRRGNESPRAVPRQAVRAEHGRAGNAGHRVALVLPGSNRNWLRRARVQDAQEVS